jgi:uncharacterized protein YjdB
MKRFLFAVLLCFYAVVAVSTICKAQSRLIHYWNFNTFTNVDTLGATSGGCTYPVTTLNRIRPIAADYSIIDTAKAKFVFSRQPGVSGSWPSVAVEAVCFTWLDFVAGSATNARLGAVAGNGVRPRNPTDSMQILIYAPTTNYQNISIKYVAINSSTLSGPTYMIFDYSLDSGISWIKTGLNKLKDSAWTVAYNQTSVSVTDPLAYNNPRFVFRIRDSIHNNTGSGNIRYDNITVEGDTVLPSGSLIYLWHFNAFSGAYHNPTFPYLAPDYFIHDSAKAKIHFGLFPGTSLSNSTYFDNVAAAAGAPDYDTVNSNWTSAGLGIIPSGSGIRMRNPNDSTYLYVYMPTVNYKNIALKFASETSSLASGDSIQLFNYSVDSGATWLLSGISEALDSPWQAGMNVDPLPIGYRPVPATIQFTDPAANNCSKLVFRIHLKGKNAGVSGNNRFDNFSVQGDSIISPLPTITTTSTAYGPLCNSANSTIYIPFATSGAVNGPYHVQLSSSLGVFPANFTSNLIDSFGGTLTSPITAIVPAGTAPGSVYRVRVVSAYPGIYGTDNGSNILLTGVAAPIAGPSVVCAAGATINLTESGSGTWSSSNPAIGSVGAATGIVTGLTPGVTTITYSVGVGCTTSTPITVNPIPASIAGLFNECIGVTTTLIDASPLGSWSGSATTVATIGTGSGTVTPIAAGNLNITYTIPNSCFVTQNVTVNPLPPTIGGASPICVGSSSTLTDAGGGIWTSSTPLQASIGSSTGLVSGLSAGVPTITYTLPTGCITTVLFTVNPNPSSIAGPSTGCVGTTTNLTDATAFGAWTSSTTTVATIGSATGIVSGLTIGSATISYTLSTGCRTSTTITINSVPSGITGSFVLCAGANSTLGSTTTGGTWSSSNTAVATIGATSGVVSGIVAGNPVITYTLPSGCMAFQTITVNPLPALIAGQSSLYCLPSSTTLTDATPGGTWISALPSVATIGSVSGLVTGVTSGSSIITYTLPTGCNTTIVETVYPTPAPITGNPNACVGATAAFTDVTAFGAWVSSNSAIATIGSGTGIATGISTGTVTISYSVFTGCVITKNITVNPVPLAITGIPQVCSNGVTTLSDATPLGIWTSNIPALASVGAVSGIVTGVAAGNPVITYTLPTGCFTTTPLTVNVSPSSIAGSSTLCTGLATTLTDITTGGVWSSSNANALVGPTTGVVTGVTTGNDTLTYTLTDGCFVARLMTINQTPAAISGINSACAGLASTLADITVGGTWTSSVPALAFVGSSTGIVTGVAAGNPVISYTSPNGCYSTITFTVNPLPAPIGGATSVYCIGSTALLTDFISGGSWSSANPAVASIDVTGLVTGVSAGSAAISYILPTSCFVTYVENITSTPAPITGVATTCISTNTTFSDLTAFGAWSSSSPSVAAIGSGTGVVTGITAGSATITYQLSPACLITKEVTVNPQPSSISGITQVCMGSATTLTDLGGGTWTSSIPALATVGTGSGVVTGVVAGIVIISYTLPTGCVTSAAFTVNPLPSISGVTSICLGLPSPLIGNISGGTWSSSNTAVATIGSLSGLISGVTFGTSVVTYLLPTGCIATTTISVNPPPAAVTGIMHVCVGLTTTLSGIGGGGWYSSDPAVASVGFGTGIVSGLTAGTATITYSLGTSCISLATITVNPLPAAITGTMVTCQDGINTLSDATTGGTWTSSNITVASINLSSGVLTGVSGGTSIITYTLPTGCITTSAVTINPVAPITGLTNVCSGLTIALSDALTGGTWVSANPAVATIGSATGVVYGNSAGSSAITYLLPSGCLSATTITVNAAPLAITGNMNVCLGTTNTLADVSAGGIWTSSNTSVAPVGTASGIVSGLILGTSSITYTLPTGCIATAVVTVDPLPVAISGTIYACLGNTSTLTDGTSGGSWSSNASSIASVVSGTGVVTGVTPGSAVITYTLPTGCLVTSSFITRPLPALQTVTGGGSYCAGGAGLHIGLSNSDTGLNYQLYIGTTASGLPMGGTGFALDFGLKTATGFYTIIAINPATTCIRNMSGSQAIATTPLPNAFTMTGGGGYCVGDTGVHVHLSHSDSGIFYQLMRGIVAVGVPLAGDGSALDFGLYTTPGLYSIVATNSLTTCTNNMTASLAIFVDTLFTPVITLSVAPGGSLMAGQTDTVHAIISGGGTSLTYQWIVNNVFIAGATNATYISDTFANKDSVTCLVVASSTCGTTITAKSIVLTIHDVSVPVTISHSDLQLTPNPNKGIFVLKGKLATSNSEEVAVTITNMLGQVVYTERLMANNGLIEKKIQLSDNVTNGMYILNFSGGNENKVFHIVVRQ